MSLIHTADLAGVNAFDYLTTLQRDASELTQTPSAWVPWNYRETPAQSSPQGCPVTRPTSVSPGPRDTQGFVVLPACGGPPFPPLHDAFGAAHHLPKAHDFVLSRF
jgi:hypothetical protein